MNTILQKRIEEAAERYAWSHDTIGVDKETFHTESSQKHPIPIDKHVRVPIYHEMEVAFKCAAHFILNNQWISVEEALPTENRIIARISESFCGTKDCIEVLHFCERYGLASPEGYYDLCGEEVPTNAITHWMPIPSLEGGEEW